jgi:hypothetical protein
MKTLNKITLATLLMILFTSASFADSFKKFKMQIKADQFIEVITKLENIIDENTFGTSELRTMEVLKECTKEEQLIEEEIPLMEIPLLRVSVEELQLIVKSITQPEHEIEENLPFTNAYTAK